MQPQSALSQAYADSASGASVQDWRPLHFFNLYRTLLAGLFLLSYLSNLGPSFFGRYNAPLFLWISASYLGFAILTSFTIRQRWLAFDTQVMLQGIVDILLTTLLMHASGGVSSGLGMLLVVAIAGSGILTAGRTAIFFAALASLAVLVESVYSDISDVFFVTGYTQAGLLGATFFATAFLAHVLARRIRASESLAKQRGLHVEYLAQLNEQIVQHIQSGIMVLDALGRVRLNNEAALRLLGIEEDTRSALLSRLSPELAGLLGQWRQNNIRNSLLFRPDSGDVDVIATFTLLQQAGNPSVLLVLEDATLTSRRAEQLKLAALGRLTASIAHEIRNPLGAISHAAQLLAESPQLAPADTRLSRIITEHSQRVNGIVENVLQLSRLRDAEIEYLDINAWLPGFVQELADYYALPPAEFMLHTQRPAIEVGFDPSQLHQVLWNLCENALRYTQGSPLLELSTGISEDSRRPYLDIRDHGPGMSDEVAGQVFEPFYTTERQGSGLGLYIARGMCAINQAVLHLLSHGPGGCCFRISFSESTQQESGSP